MFPGVRLVSLNTQYGDMINFWLYAGDGTGGPDQMKWLSDTLSEARRNNELVFIAYGSPFPTVCVVEQIALMTMQLAHAVHGQRGCA